MYKEKTVIELKCDYDKCKSIMLVENYIRPEHWTFITIQNDKFLEPATKHFCPSCSFQIKFPFKL